MTKKKCRPVRKNINPVIVKNLIRTLKALMYSNTYNTSAKKVDFFFFGKHFGVCMS